MSLASYAVRRETFHIPSEFAPLMSVGLARYGSTVLVQYTPAKGGGSDETATGTDKVKLLVHRISNIVKDEAKLRCILKILRFHASVPQDLSNIVPLVDVYCASHEPEHVYLVYPAVDATLADVLRSPTQLQPDQIILIIRELATILGVLHSNKLVLGELRPETVALFAPLSMTNAIAVLDVSAIVAEGTPLPLSPWTAVRDKGCADGAALPVTSTAATNPSSIHEDRAAQPPHVLFAGNQHHTDSSSQPAPDLSSTAPETALLFSAQPKATAPRPMICGP